eukprot:COSAG04_NODE_67_length_29431_cov_17.894313_12_plen_296_part_00
MARGRLVGARSARVAEVIRVVLVLARPAWRGCSLAGHEPCTSGNRRSRRELQRENRLRSCTRERSRTKGDEDADQWQVDPGGHSLSLTVSSELVAHARSRPRLARVISGRGRAGEGIRCVGRLCFKRFTLNVYPALRAQGNTTGQSGDASSRWLLGARGVQATARWAAQRYSKARWVPLHHPWAGTRASQPASSPPPRPPACTPHPLPALPQRQRRRPWARGHGHGVPKLAPDARLARGARGDGLFGKDRRRALPLRAAPALPPPPRRWLGAGCCSGCWLLSLPGLSRGVGAPGA